MTVLGKTILQGSVATPLRCGGIVSNHLTLNFLQNPSVKECPKSVNIRQSYHENFDAPFFGTHCMCLCLVKLKFHRTDTDTDTDTDFLADFSAMILARKSACPARTEVGVACRGEPRQSASWTGRGARGRPTCPRTFVRRAFFAARMSVWDARVYTCTCTVHDKLSCTRLQNYTIGASLKSVSVSVLVP